MARKITAIIVVSHNKQPNSNDYAAELLPPLPAIVTIFIRFFLVGCVTGRNSNIIENVNV